VNNKLIFVEGPKGVGKTLLTRKAASRPVGAIVGRELTCEPWISDIVNMADNYLFATDPTTQAMLYAADRRAHMREVIDWLTDDHIICDRGPVSTMVYQGLVGGVDLDWLLDLNGVAMEGITVAATILLHAPFEITVQRIEGRGTPLTQQERDQLRPAWEAYESLRLGAHDANGHLQHFVSEWKDITGWIHYIDANRPAAEVEADVIATIDRIIQGA
jgi:thymidylate kinase